MSDPGTCEEWLREILHEIDNLPSGSFWIRDLREGKYHFPVSLPTGDGRSIAIRPEIDKRISNFAKMLMHSHFRCHKSRFFSREWHRIVRQAIGMVLANCNEGEDIENDAARALTDVVEGVRTQIGEILEREYAFGCHLFAVPDIDAFAIGSVRVESRVDWLSRMQKEGALSKGTHRRIGRVWNGEKVRERKRSDDAIYEREIIETVGDGEYVCSVAVGRMGEEMALRKGLTGARIALAAIALSWIRPSFALNRFVLLFDEAPHLQRCVLSFPGGGRGWYGHWLALPHGVPLTKEQWASTKSEYGGVFAVVGEAVDFVTEGRRKTRRPRTMDRISQSLLWFYEACSEREDAMAIVKFCSSMEALAGGKRSNGIRKLVEVRLGIRDEGAFGQLLGEIYSDGRSRTVHGTNARLGEDWRGMRLAAEDLARELLLACVKWIDEECEADDPKLLLQGNA